MFEPGLEFHLPAGKVTEAAQQFASHFDKLDLIMPKLLYLIDQGLDAGAERHAVILAPGAR